MTTNELVNYYVKSVSLGSAEYTANRADPLLPFLLTDICYQTYLSVIKRIQPRHEMKRLDALCKKTFHRIFNPFFAAYPKDLQEEVTDLMDSLTESLSNDLTILRSMIMNIIDDLTFEQKQNEADLLMCYILAEFAQTAWGNIYKVSRVTRFSERHERHKNLDIEQVKTLSFKLAWGYFQPFAKGNIRLSEIKAEGIFQQITNHIYKWIENND